MDIDCPDIFDCSCASCDPSCGERRKRKKHKKQHPHHQQHPQAHPYTRHARPVSIPATSRPLRWWSVSRRLGIAAIRGYQKHLSPRLPVTCRYTPSCSHYGLAAVTQYGVLRGGRLAWRRIRSCTAEVPHGTPDPLLRRTRTPAASDGSLA